VAFQLVNPMAIQAGYAFGGVDYSFSISLKAFVLLPISRSLIEMWVILRL